MRNTLLFKSGFGLLMLAGALSPLATQAFEGDGYDQLRAFQPEKKWTTAAERGAQGPIRTDGMDESASSKLSVGEGDLYDNLKLLQGEQKTAIARHGAQGPVRTERMDSFRRFAESDMYDNLKVDSSL